MTTMNGSEMVTVAPAERPVLTHCAICARPLTDAASIEIGIGPICRKRCEYDSIPEHLRVKANEIIRLAAMNLDNRGTIFVAADRLFELGLARLAACLVDRFATVHLAASNGSLVVRTPYVPDFASKIRAAGGRWGWLSVRQDPGARLTGFLGKGWTVPDSKGHRAAVWAAITSTFGGSDAPVVKIHGQAAPVWMREHADMPNLDADPEPKEETPKCKCGAPVVTASGICDDCAEREDADVQVPVAIVAAPAPKSANRSEAAKRAWVTIRANRAAAAAKAVQP